MHRASGVILILQHGKWKEMGAFEKCKTFGGTFGNNEESFRIEDSSRTSIFELGFLKDLDF